jgi:arabinose-5-phosphate isomerase
LHINVPVSILKDAPTEPARGCCYDQVFCDSVLMIPPTPPQLIRIEAEALLRLAARLEDGMSARFARAAELVVECGQRGGRVVVTGIGKSGIIAQKLVATFNSTGTPALFLHPAEALHGDLGMLAKGDLVVALSSSGETEEVLRLLPALKRMGDALISFCCVMTSTLALASDVALDVSVEQEACGLGLAPTASTTVMLALGDALAIAVSLKKGFRAEDFADLHPGGKLGKKLARVRELMQSGDAVPRVSAATPMPAVIYEMSRKGLGMTTVTEGETLIGMMSDGDLRRLLEAKGPGALALTAVEAMNPSPQTIAADEFAARALGIMEEKKITSLVVVDSARKVAGVLHLHGLWGLDLI